jgi:glucose/mannose-6-phosphate isomerase
VYGLDGPDALQGDSLGLIRGSADSVAAFDEARAAAEAAEIPWPADEVDSVAVCGMGGSAIAADLILGAYRERMRVPCAVVRDYYIPGWIGERTLVILSSYSGGTEETLTAASQAIERNALCVAITSGGKLAQFYGPEGVPVIPVRPGLQPRAALLRLLVPMLVVLDRMGVIGNIGSDL